MAILRPQIKKADSLFFLAVFGLALFGIIMVFESSSVTAFQDFGDKFYYVRQQSMWFIIGIISLLFCARINYKYWQKIAAPLMTITVLLLVIVLIPGIGIQSLGARRWINLGFTGFQPAELVKLSMVIYFSKLFSLKPKFIPFIITLATLIGLIMLEPDLGTTVILVISGFSLFFASGAPLSSFIITGVMGLFTGILLIFGSSYRRERFFTFLDPSRDPLGASYHISQILLALGSGGLLGVGIGASRQKYAYLPEAMTDSIFAVIAEEVGFIGAVVLILFFLFLIYRGIKIAMEAPDRFSQLLALGIISWIGAQAFVNLAAMVALVPLTGVPLPFVSYGGSSLVINLVGIGILLNISRHSTAKK